MKHSLSPTIWLLQILLLGACKPAVAPPEASEPPPRPIAEAAQTREATPPVPDNPDPSPQPSPSTNRTAAPSAPNTATPTRTTPHDFATELVVYELRLDRSALKKLNASPYSDATCPASFLAGGVTFDGARVRYRGQWARSWPKKPLKVFLPKDKPYQGYTTLNLNSPWRDPALIREVLAYHVYAACGAPSPRARVVRLQINGQFEGLYIDVEQPKRQFLKRIGMPRAAIYKALGRSNTSDERDLGSLQSFATQYEKETREDEGFEDLQKFCHGLANAAEDPAFFEQNVDVDRLVNYLAAGVLVQNWDAYNKNHHLVHDIEGSGKWFPTPWDVDRTLGDHWNGSFEAFDLPVLLGTRGLPGVTGWNRLADNFLRIPAYRARFLNRLEALLEQEFTPAKLYPFIDRWSSLIAQDASLDRARWRGGDRTFQAGIVQLKKFIEKRRMFLLREIAELRRADVRRGPQTPR